LKSLFGSSHPFVPEQLVPKAIDRVVYSSTQPRYPANMAGRIGKFS
jgi:hypothetical protein